MINIAITGANGKMGKVINYLIKQRNDCKVIAGIDLNIQKYDDFEIYSNINLLPQKPDVIIDFSNPVILDDLLSYVKINNIPLVIATTGFSKEQINLIHKSSEQVPIFFTFNMSLGVNLMVELGKKAASVLGDQFDIEILEKHHKMKIDSPSGTAIMIAEALNETLENNYKFVYDRHSVRKARDKDEIGIQSIRGGTIVGEHEIIFAGHDEVLTISHSALSKEVFAVGAVNAAIFLAGKKKGLYDMKDLV